MGSDDPNGACKDKHAPCSDKSSFTMLQSYQMASKTLSSVDNDLDSDQIKPQQLAEAEKKYADLAEKCVANESALSANVIRAVDGMKRELGAVWMYINTTHIADISRSSHSLQRYNKCHSDMKQALDVGGVVRNWMDETTQAETQHNNCEAGEALLYDSMVDAKSSMETAILASNADECTKQFLPSKLFNPKPKVECIKKVVKWAQRSNKILVETYAKFVAANEGHKTKRNECTTMQHQFEAKFCEFSTAYKDACSARTACENAARKDYDQMKAEVKKTMQIRKSDFVAATHIDCYLGVILLAHNAENGVGLQGKLNECQDRVIDTSELDLVVVDLPENTPCDMTPTAPEPGETGWAKERYENKKWYEKASPIDSVVCTPKSTTCKGYACSESGHVIDPTRAATKNPSDSTCGCGKVSFKASTRGSNSCPSGTDFILDEDLCKKAAQVLRKRSPTKSSHGHIPVGCQFAGVLVYFDTNPSNTAHSGHTLICVGPEAPPTPAPPVPDCDSAVNVQNAIQVRTTSYASSKSHKKFVIHPGATFVGTWKPTHQHSDYVVLPGGSIDCTTLKLGAGFERIDVLKGGHVNLKTCGHGSGGGGVLTKLNVENLDDVTWPDDVDLAKGLKWKGQLKVCAPQINGLKADGECKRQCSNGGSENDDCSACTDCDGGFSEASDCTKCEYACAHGTQSPTSCLCTCDAGWWGEKCDDQSCPLSIGTSAITVNTNDFQSTKTHTQFVIKDGAKFIGTSSPTQPHSDYVVMKGGSIDCTTLKLGRGFERIWVQEGGHVNLKTCGHGWGGSGGKYTKLNVENLNDVTWPDGVSADGSGWKGELRVCHPLALSFPSCSSTDGSGSSTSYPCKCGTTTCVSGEKCEASSNTCTGAAQASADGYTKTPGERCVNQWDAFNTIQEAKVACTAKAQCTGIYDSTFFGGGIVLCWTSRKESDRNANEYTYWKQAR